MRAGYPQCAVQMIWGPAKITVVVEFPALAIIRVDASSDGK